MRELTNYELMEVDGGSLLGTAIKAALYAAASLTGVLGGPVIIAAVGVGLIINTLAETKE